MRTLSTTALFFALIALAGCGSMSLESKRVDYKSAAASVPSLEIPPDLTAPETGNHYTVPEDSQAAANYSDFAKRGGNALPQAGGAVSVLPETRNVRMERHGTQRWLVVDDKAENVWPVIKAFWKENGFVIKTENPQAGIMETDWAENRAKISRGGLRSVLGKVLDGMYDSGEKDMYRVRLERSTDGSSTEIYVAHYGKEQVLSADKSITNWQSRPNDPELEASMLQMLMTRLGGMDAAKAFDTAQSAQESAAAPALQVQADGSQVILLGEPFDRSWRTVGLALERAGFAVVDRDRASGVYFLRVEEAARKKGLFDKLAFWRKEESAKPARYQVTVHETAKGCEVAANNGGGNNPTTQRIIDELYKALGK